MILIDAVYINNSGGKTLLLFLIDSIIKRNLHNIFFFLLDQRLYLDNLNLKSLDNIATVRGSEFERSKFYQQNSNKFDVFFCFANVPPPIKIKQKKVYILFHNSLILDSSNKNYSLLQQFKFRFKRLYIWYITKSSYAWIVQSNTMKNLLREKLNLKDSNINRLPIYDTDVFINLNKQLKENDNNYLYVADGVSQKNHQILLKAWEVLHDKYKKFPVLHLTIPSNYLSLVSEIKRLNDKGVFIINHGYCTIEQLKNLYSECNYFLMPSLSESFGLPLIEAAIAGCEIIAADLPYVYDVVEPILTFNPSSINDLVKCILSEKKENRKTKLLVKNEIDILLNLLTNNAKK